DLGGGAQDERVIGREADGDLKLLRGGTGLAVRRVHVAGDGLGHAVRRIARGDVARLRVAHLGDVQLDHAVDVSLLELEAAGLGGLGARVGVDCGRRVGRVANRVNPGRGGTGGNNTTG